MVCDTAVPFVSKLVTSVDAPEIAVVDSPSSSWTSGTTGPIGSTARPQRSLKVLDRALGLGALRIRKRTDATTVLAFEGLGSGGISIGESRRRRNYDSCDSNLLLTRERMSPVWAVGYPYPLHGQLHRQGADGREGRTLPTYPADGPVLPPPRRHAALARYGVAIDGSLASARAEESGSRLWPTGDSIRFSSCVSPCVPFAACVVAVLP